MVCIQYILCVFHEPITVLYYVHGRQGMEKVDFGEKTTAAKAFGHLQYLHELFVYGYAINLVGICLCRYVRGCVQSCDDIDGCNSCHNHHQSLLVTLLLLLSLVHLKIN